jgi:hypothetical protein
MLQHMIRNPERAPDVSLHQARKGRRVTGSNARTERRVGGVRTRWRARTAGALGVRRCPRDGDIEMPMRSTGTT